MSKIVLVDADGVLLNWMDTFREWAEQRGYNEVNPGVYDMHLYYNIAKEDAKNLIIEFNESAAICQLAAFRDSKYWVKRIYEELGYKFRVITSLSTCPYAGKAREMNLKQHFGDAIETVICLETGADKDDALTPYMGSGLVWVEDKFQNYALGKALGLKSILMEHDHNADEVEHDDVVVQSWKQIYKIIKKGL